MKTKQILAAAAAAAVFLVTGAAGVSSAREHNASMAQRTMEAQELWSAMLHRSQGAEQEFPEEEFLACLDIVGTIQPSPSSRFAYTADGQYDHTLYMDYIDLLMDCPQNKGLMLYVDSPGGTVYESDEMYLKLMEYKETTSRPIYPSTPTLPARPVPAATTSPWPPTRFTPTATPGPAPSAC